MSALLIKIALALSALLPGIAIEGQKVWGPCLAMGNAVESIFVAIPYWGVKVIVTVFFLGLAVTPFFLPKDYIFKGAEGQPLWKDLRYWTLAVALSEVIVYLYF